MIQCTMMRSIRALRLALVSSTATSTSTATTTTNTMMNNTNSIRTASTYGTATTTTSTTTTTPHLLPLSNSVRGTSRGIRSSICNMVGGGASSITHARTRRAISTISRTINTTTTTTDTHCSSFGSIGISSRGSSSSSSSSSNSSSSTTTTTGSRLYSTGVGGVPPTHPPPPDLSAEAAKSIVASTIAALENEHMAYSKAMGDIRANDTNLPLIVRWQGMVQLLLSVQLHTIVPYGYAPDDRGLRDFHMALAKVCSQEEKDGEINALLRRRWTVILEKSFGFTFREQDRISLDQARQLSSIMGLRMQSEDFLKKVDEAIVSVLYLVLCVYI